MSAGGAGGGQSRRGLRGMFDRVALGLWGPPDLDPDAPPAPNPFTGTKYDPEVKKAAKAARKRAKG